MNRDLGVWTSEDCALVLIDYQKELFDAIRSETDAGLVELHVRWLVKTAKAFGMPIVLSTVGVAHRANGPTRPAIVAEMPDIEPIDRSSMNAFDDPVFREAVDATGRKRLIIAGLHTEVWYFNEVPKLTPDIGIALAERVRAEGQVAQDVVAA